ncbi:hypothetical protein BGP_1365 [Beggiatoa sp. PS]|nr:hypothetical protein BGP_1365 [Beggiatoa sp. PS]
MGKWLKKTGQFKAAITSYEEAIKLLEGEDVWLKKSKPLEGEDVCLKNQNLMTLQ